MAIRLVIDSIAAKECSGDDKGLYTLEESIERIDKNNCSMNMLKLELYELQKHLDTTEKMNNEERLKNLSVFLENMGHITDVSLLNDLYQTIINSIEYLNDGEEVRLTINFK